MPQSTITFETCASQNLPIPVFAPAGIALDQNGAAIVPAALTNGAVSSFTLKAGQLVRITAPSGVGLNVTTSLVSSAPTLASVQAAHYLAAGVYIDFITPDDGTGKCYLYVTPSANVASWAPGRLTGAEIHS